MAYSKGHNIINECKSRRQWDSDDDEIFWKSSHQDPIKHMDNRKAVEKNLNNDWRREADEQTRDRSRLHHEERLLLPSSFYTYRTSSSQQSRENRASHSTSIYNYGHKNVEDERKCYVDERKEAMIASHRHSNSKRLPNSYFKHSKGYEYHSNLPKVDYYYDLTGVKCGVKPPPPPRADPTFEDLRADAEERRIRNSITEHRIRNLITHNLYQQSKNNKAANKPPSSWKLLIQGASSIFNSDNIERVTQEMTDYFKSLNLNPFTWNKEGSVTNGGGYAYGTSGPDQFILPAKPDGYCTREENMVPNIADIASRYQTDANIGLQGDQYASTNIMDDIIALSIANSPSANKYAYYPTLLFDPQNSPSNRNVQNFNHSTTELIFLPFNYGGSAKQVGHHCLFVYDRRQKETDGTRHIYHYNPFGNTSLIPYTHSGQCKRIVEAIEGQRMTTKFIQPPIAEVAKQRDAVNCGLYVMDYIQSFIDGANPSLITVHDIQQSRYRYERILQETARRHQMPVESLNRRTFQFESPTAISQTPSLPFQAPIFPNNLLANTFIISKSKEVTPAIPTFIPTSQPIYPAPRTLPTGIPIKPRADKSISKKIDIVIVPPLNPEQHCPPNVSTVTPSLPSLSPRKPCPPPIVEPNAYGQIFNNNPRLELPRDRTWTITREYGDINNMPIFDPIPTFFDNSYNFRDESTWLHDSVGQRYPRGEYTDYRDIANSTMHDMIGNYDFMSDNNLMHYTSHLVRQFQRCHDIAYLSPLWMTSPIGYPGSIVGMAGVNFATTTRIIIIPLNMGQNHWSVMVFNRDDGSMICYDSKPDFRRNYANEYRRLFNVLKAELDFIFGPQPSPPLTIIQNMPIAYQQRDGFSCGAFVLRFIEKQIRNENFMLDVNFDVYGYIKRIQQFYYDVFNAQNTPLPVPSTKNALKNAPLFLQQHSGKIPPASSLVVPTPVRPNASTVTVSNPIVPSQITAKPVVPVQPTTRDSIMPKPIQPKIDSIFAPIKKTVLPPVSPLKIKPVISDALRAVKFNAKPIDCTDMNDVQIFDPISYIFNTNINVQEHILFDRYGQPIIRNPFVNLDEFQSSNRELEYIGDYTWLIESNITNTLSILIKSHGNTDKFALINPQFFQLGKSNQTADQFMNYYSVNLNTKTEVLFMPVIINASHWITIVYHRNRLHLELYDPSPKYYNDPLFHGMYLKTVEIIRPLLQIAFNQIITNSATILQPLPPSFTQKDNISCGLFILRFMELLIVNRSWLEDQDFNVYGYRKRLQDMYLEVHQFCKMPLPSLMDHQREWAPAYFIQYEGQIPRCQNPCSPFNLCNKTPFEMADDLMVVDVVPLSKAHIPVITIVDVPLKQPDIPVIDKNEMDVDVGLPSKPDFSVTKNTVHNIPENEPFVKKFRKMLNTGVPAKLPMPTCPVIETPVLPDKATAKTHSLNSSKTNEQLLSEKREYERLRKAKYRAKNKCATQPSCSTTSSTHRNQRIRIKSIPNTASSMNVLNTTSQMDTQTSMEVDETDAPDATLLPPTSRAAIDTWKFRDILNLNLNETEKEFNNRLEIQYASIGLSKAIESLLMLIKFKIKTNNNLFNDVNALITPGYIQRWKKESRERRLFILKRIEDEYSIDLNSQLQLLSQYPHLKEQISSFDRMNISAKSVTILGMLMEVMSTHEGSYTADQLKTDLDCIVLGLEKLSFLEDTLYQQFLPVKQSISTR